MGTCEMCGEAGDLKKTRVEGASLKLCQNCQEFGEVVDEPTPSRRTRTSRRSSTPEEDVLPGYDKDVKTAREARDLSVKELANALKEKESVVRRVESGKLTPDRKLAGKFERELGIEIYGKPPEAPQTGSGQDSGEQTVGDVADVKKG